MASNDAAARPASPGDDDGLPNPQVLRSEAPGPPSIISSRMTDIASEDGDGDDAQKNGGNKRKSAVGSDGRPGTAKTGVSSTKGAWPQAQPLRKNYLSGLAAKRGSVGAGSIASSLGRSPSTKSRSHVPSLTSHAFFHPMSSQKLQAQRGGPRQSSMYRQQAELDDGVGADAGGPQRPLSDDGEVQPPASRGSDVTGQDTLDRITANTSPTPGHRPQASLTESMRPLQPLRGKQTENRNLNVDVDKTYKDRGNLPSPLKSPRSFRSSFLLPGKNDAAQNSSTRALHGAEKLSSTASSPRLAPADTNTRSQKSKPVRAKADLGRVHQYFDGNTVFWFGGRFQNAKQRPVNVATGLFVVVPGVLFFIFSAPWLWHNISPAIPIVFAYLFYLCFSSFIHASVSDPGILPRNLHNFPPTDENEDPLRLGPPTNDWVLIKSAEDSTAAMEVPVKHCRTCNIWRPPRAHHCRLCDNCIETHDHHCVWVNNCIGRRNYRYFFAFVTSATILSIYLIAVSLVQIIVYMNREGIMFADAIDHFRVPFAMVVYGVVAILYPIALMGYHIFLMARGETTREYINSHKFVKKERYRAFTRGGWFKNWIAVLCRPRPPTYYQFKNKYAVGDQRLSERRDRRPRADSQGVEMQDVKPAASSFQRPLAPRDDTNP